jgi:uncharacterized protein (DUF2236 family)
VTSPSESGHFTADSVIRRVGRESVLMLGGARALLMQAAHPRVAAGIVEHSDYAIEPWKRLGRTLTALYTVVFGTRDEADAVAQAVRAVHRGVRGRTSDGARYSARDPELQLWVHATLVSTGIAMHDVYVRPLRPDEGEAFYQDMKVVARVFGVPARVLPETHDDFRAYEQTMLREVLRVGEDARRVAATITHPPVPFVARPAVVALARANVGLLPQQLRDAYGFAWHAPDRAALAASARLVRTFLPLAPAPVRNVKRARDRRNGLALALLALAAR